MMVSLKNASTTCRTRLAKLRNVARRAPGPTLLAVCLIGMCLAVPYLKVAPNEIHLPTSSLEPNDGNNVKKDDPTNAFAQLIHDEIHLPTSSLEPNDGNNVIQDDPTNAFAQLIHDVVKKNEAIIQEKDEIHLPTSSLEPNDGNNVIQDDPTNAVAQLIHDVVKKNVGIIQEKDEIHLHTSSLEPNDGNNVIHDDPTNAFAQQTDDEIHLHTSSLEANDGNNVIQDDPTNAFAQQTDDVVKKNTETIKEKDNPYLTERGQRKYEMLGREDMLTSDGNCKRTLPDAIIIGVMKAGTEAFSTFLAINPQIAMSLNVRSTLFFTSRYYKGLAWYQHQMSCKSGNQITVEKAPQYFSGSMAPRRIHQMNRNIKLILLVRNPIDRAISHYLQVKNSHPEEINGMSFEDIVFASNGDVNGGKKYIALSKYSTILKRWLTYFHLSQILVLDGDQFKEDQIKVLSKAESFLGIKHYITDDKFVYDKEKGFYCLKGESSPICLGSGKGREHPTLERSDYQKLRSYFKPYNEEFFRMVRRRFDW